MTRKGEKKTKLYLASVCSLKCDDQTANNGNTKLGLRGWMEMALFTLPICTEQ